MIVGDLVGHGEHYSVFRAYGQEKERLLLFSRCLCSEKIQPSPLVRVEEQPEAYRPACAWFPAMITGTPATIEPSGLAGRLGAASSLRPAARFSNPVQPGASDRGVNGRTGFPAAMAAGVTQTRMTFEDLFDNVMGNWPGGAWWMIT